MQSNFQSTIATSQFSLPVLVVLGVLSWLFLPAKDTYAWCEPDYGLWSFVPLSAQTGYLGLLSGIFFTSLVIYLMVEFCNAMVLLNTNSRMLSCTLIIIMSLSLCLHRLQPSHVVMLASLISFFALFSSYQNESPELSFVAHLAIAAASLVCPKIILLTPFIFLVQLYVNCLSFRTFFASLIAIIVPYWFFFVCAVCKDDIGMFTNFFRVMFDFSVPDYSVVATEQWLMALNIVVFFVAGCVNYLFTTSKSRTRQRTVFNTFMMHGFISLLLFLVMPNCVNVIMGMLAIDASILCGRFWILSNNRFTHVFFVILGLFSLVILLVTVNM